MEANRPIYYKSHRSRSYKFIEKELLIETEKPDTNGNNENRFIYF